MKEKLLLPNGKYMGNVQEYGIMKTKKGNFVPFIQVKLSSPQEVVTWYGSMKTEKSRSYVAGVFKNLGLIFNEQPSPDRTWEAFCIALEQDEPTLRLKNCEVSVTMEQQMGYVSGKMESQVKFVNRATTKFQKVKPSSMRTIGEGPDFDPAKDDDMPF